MPVQFINIVAGAEYKVGDLSPEQQNMLETHPGFTKSLSIINCGKYDCKVAPATDSVIRIYNRRQGGGIGITKLHPVVLIAEDGGEQATRIPYSPELQAVLESGRTDATYGLLVEDREESEEQKAARLERGWTITPKKFSFTPKPYHAGGGDTKIIKDEPKAEAPKPQQVRRQGRQ